jgi:hypothetical protein
MGTVEALRLICKHWPDRIQADQSLRLVFTVDQEYVKGSVTGT